MRRPLHFYWTGETARLFKMLMRAGAFELGIQKILPEQCSDADSFSRMPQMQRIAVVSKSYGAPGAGIVWGKNWETPGEDDFEVAISINELELIPGALTVSAPFWGHMTSAFPPDKASMAFSLALCCGLRKFKEKGMTVYSVRSERVDVKYNLEADAYRIFVWGRYAMCGGGPV